jgi:hypothetical protein
MIGPVFGHHHDCAQNMIPDDPNPCDHPDDIKYKNIDRKIPIGLL